MFDFKELKLQIKRVYETQEAFAKAMNMTKTALSQRLNNAVSWKMPEVYLACKLLKINFENIEMYFFKVKCFES